MHHFAHSTGHNCEYGYESSLHLACKEILSNAKKITIPPVYVTFPDTNKKDELVCSAKEIEIEKVELEQRFRDIIPDVVVYSGKKKFFIEIYVTHSIDNNKLQKLKEANISTIEIDLSKERTTITVSELSDLLLCNNERKNGNTTLTQINGSTNSVPLQMNAKLLSVGLRCIFIVQSSHRFGLTILTKISAMNAHTVSTVFLSTKIIFYVLGDDKFQLWMI